MARQTRAEYAAHFGPTVGDRVRLADTELMLEIERIVGRELGDSEADAILCCASVGDVCTVLADIVEDATSSGEGVELDPGSRQIRPSGSLQVVSSCAQVLGGCCR